MLRSRHALVLALGLACGRHGTATRDDGQDLAFVRTEGDYVIPDASPLRERLSVAPVVTQEVHSQLVAPATVEAQPSRMAKISPPLPGRVVKLFVHFGDAVTVGAPLFTLDSPDLVSAQTDYLKAKSGFAQSEKNLARQKDLVEHGIGAQRELEQSQTDRDNAQSELDRSTTRLRLLGKTLGFALMFAGIAPVGVHQATEKHSREQVGVKKVAKRRHTRRQCSQIRAISDGERPNDLSRGLPASSLRSAVIVAPSGMPP